MSEPSPGSDCHCGSGKRYAECCGQAEALRWNEKAFGRVQGNLMDPGLVKFVADEPVCEFEGMSLPPGILVRKLTPDYHWQGIAEKILSTPDAAEAKVSFKDGESKVSATRVTGIVDQGAMAQPVIELVRNAYAREVEPFFNCKLRSMETPQILRYTRGSHYRPHADSDVVDRDTQRWKKAEDRDYSLLIYLDEDFEGGELIFPNFDFKLTPQRGMLAVFPSDFRYLHGAMPVLSGVRHAIVSWCAIKQ